MRWRCSIAFVACLLACSESRSPAGGGELDLADVTWGDAGANGAVSAGDGATHGRSPAAEALAPPTAPAGELRDLLVGYWLNEQDNGNCITFSDWYSFAPNGAATRQLNLSSECSNSSGWYRDDGEYALNGRDLLVHVSHPPIDDPDDGISLLIIESVDRIERMTVAIEERPATRARPAVIFLDDRAFSGDGRRFESVRSLADLAPGGVRLQTHEVRVTLQLNQDLRQLALGDALEVELHAELQQYHTSDGIERNATIDLAYAAHVTEEHGLLRILPDVLAGLAQDEALAAWQNVVNNASVSRPPPWARALFAEHFFPSQRYHPADVTVLTSSSPPNVRWLRSASPPPAP